MIIPWLDWASLAIRWLHLAAGIAWIGTSFYFIWLDRSLRARENLPKGVQGESQQRSGKNQLLHVNNQSNQTADAERSGFELPAADGEQQQQRNR